MNNATVLKCAQMAANQQQSFLGVVDQDIQDLIAELTPAAPVAEPVVEAPAKTKKAKSSAEEAPAEATVQE